MDTNLNSILKPFLDKAHPAVREFIISGDLEDTLDYITQRYNLNENELLDLNNLVCSILIGIVSPDELLDEVSKITLLTPALSERLATEIQDIILLTLASKISPVTPPPSINNSISKPVPNNIGQSFEQIILNQARAMQPARPAGAPVNLPIAKESEMPIQRPIERPIEREEKPESTQSTRVPNYSGGNDPYREPV